MPLGGVSEYEDATSPKDPLENGSTGYAISLTPPNVRYNDKTRSAVEKVRAAQRGGHDSTGGVDEDALTGFTSTSAWRKIGSAGS
jgi:hypothetical protein